VLNFLAARFYYKTGDHERAISALKASLWDEDLNYRSSYDSDIPKLELYAAILEDSGKNPETLGKLRDMLEQHKEARLYDEIKDIGYQDQRRYKVGLKVRAGASQEGVLVVRAHEGYPFAKAGAREGDRIFEFAHREIETLRDIWIPLLEFDPGTELPFKVKRGKKIVDLMLVVE
jgi:C-terminal processing protease CtpA/Prc